MVSTLYSMSRLGIDQHEQAVSESVSVQQLWDSTGTAEKDLSALEDIFSTVCLSVWLFYGACLADVQHVPSYL